MGYLQRKDIYSSFLICFEEYRSGHECALLLVCYILKVFFISYMKVEIRSLKCLNKEFEDLNVCPACPEVSIM